MKKFISGWYAISDQGECNNPDLQEHKTPQEAVDAHNARLWNFINKDSEKKKNIINLKSFFKDTICDVRCVIEKGLPNRVCFLTIEEGEKTNIPVVNNEMIKSALEFDRLSKEHAAKSR